MAPEVDLVIDALQAGNDELVAVLTKLTPEQLTGRSAASEWSVAQVLSHLGSGAVITLATLDAAIAGRANPDQEANRKVWAVWDGMSAQEQADGFVAANDALLARLTGLDPAARQSLRSDMGFLPEPVDLATVARFRLSEFTLHSWDVRVALDPDATLDPDTAALLLDQVAFMLGWIAKPAALAGRTANLKVELTEPATSFGLALGESISIGAVAAEPDGVLRAPAEAWLRLTTGRLPGELTPASLELTGDLTLDTLRQVFPGF